MPHEICHNHDYYLNLPTKLVNDFFVKKKLDLTKIDQVGNRTGNLEDMFQENYPRIPTKGDRQIARSSVNTIKYWILQCILNELLSFVQW